MNKKQKSIVKVAIIIVFVLLILWISFGAEILTKSEVLVERYDEVFDTTYEEWQDKFVPGLDLFAAVSFLVLLISSILIYFKREK